MRKAHGVSALLIGIAAICAGAAADSATAAAPASLPVPSGVYAGTIELPDPFARYLDQPFRLTLSRPRRIVRLPRFRVYMDCPHGYVAWWTYVLPELHTRAGRFNAHRRITRVRAGHSWRTSLDLRGRIVPAPVPGVAGRLRATIWVPRIDRGGARVCRSGFRRFDMTVTRGAPTAHGALRQLPGRAGCVTPRGRGGCTPAPSSLGTKLVASPDGRHVYTNGGNGVFAFSRAPGTGALSPLDGSSACLSVGGDPGCAPADRMRFPSGFAFSPDGTSLYVPWSDHSGPGMSRSGLSVLRRDPATGTLSELAGDGGCLDDQGLEGCTRWMHIVSSPGIAAAPDGRHVYVGTQGFGDYFGGLRVAMLKVDPATGGLRPPDPAVCPGALEDVARESACAPFADGFSITFGGGGRNLYADDRALRRDPETGLLTPVAGRKGCYFVPDRDAPNTDPPLSSCTALRAFVGIVEDVVASPDGRQVYMIDEGTAVGGLSRNPATGGLSPMRVLGGCARSGAGAGCSNLRAFDGPQVLSMAPDGRTIYAAAFQSDSIAILNRDPRTGALWQLAGRNGCVSGGNRRENRTLTCSEARALRFPWDMIVSPDGLNVYALTEAGIAVFGRRAR